MPQLLAVMSATHIIVIVAVVLLLFGAQKIPELMRSMGSGLNEFKRGMRDGEQALPREPEPAKETTSPRQG